MTKKTFLIAFSLIFMTGAVFSFGAFAQDYQQVLETLDSRSNFTTDLAATATMTIQDPDEGNEVQKVQMFRRDEDDTFLMLIQEPVVQLGQGYLKVEDNLWFYDPESRQFTHTALDENFQGSDAKNSDFGASSMAEDYRVLSSKETTLGQFKVYEMELEAVHDEVTYPYMTIWVTRDNYLLLKAEEYSLTKRLLRTSLYPNYARVGESYLATRMIFVDELVEDKSTQMVLSNISGAEIPDHVFTKAYVEQVNR